MEENIESKLAEDIQADENKKVIEVPLGKVLMSVVLTVGIQLVAMLVIAGRWDWIEAWVYYGVYSILFLSNGLWMRKNNPEIVKKRMGKKKTKDEWKSWDKKMTLVLGIFYILLLLIVGLDGGRYQWSSVAVGLKVVAQILMIPAFLLIHFVMRENAFLSKRVEIQESDNQTVITTGPYKLVRHPMYLGMIVMYFLFSLVLGSLWGLIPAGLNTAAMMVRAKLEDDTLQQELPGYKEFTQQTKYRIIPGIW